MTITQTESLNFAIRTQKAYAISQNYMIGSMGVALIPIPFIDLVAVSSIQLKMLHRLANLYQIEFYNNIGKSVISALLGGFVPISVTATMASATKGAFGVGTITGMISMSILSGAATYAISRVFIQHFESGGTFLDFHPEKVREYFMNEFEQGQKIAAQFKEEVLTESVVISSEKEKETVNSQTVASKQSDDAASIKTERKASEEDFFFRGKYCSQNYK